jgi:biuret amidohydrolase
MGYKIESIDPARTAVLVIDMQNDFVAEGAPLEFPEGRQIVPTIQRLLDAARELGMPVVYTAHVHRPDGTDLGRHREIYPLIAAGGALVDGEEGGEIYPELAPHPGEPVIRKHRYSSFYNTDLATVLSGYGVDTLILTGVTTEACVLSTARGALELDYKVIVASDGCASCEHPDIGQGAMAAAEMHAAALRTLAYGTGDVATVDECLSRIEQPVAAS